MKTVAVLFKKNFYQINNKLKVIFFNIYFFIYKLKVNGKIKSLPYRSEAVHIKKNKNYIKMETNLFTVYFDGDQKMKFQTCENKICGLCKISNNYSSNKKYNLRKYKVTSKNEKC